MLILTIRPVDLQVLIPRVTEVGKTQHIVDHQDTLQQQQFADKWQHISSNRQQQVQSTGKSDSSKVGRDNHPKEQNHSKNEQNQHNPKATDADMENHASNEDPVRGNLIDIKT
ncbi:hypothetical protein [Pelosinus sp. sgz500959]|uniref:hypothetical protein n=1 Tax=Pelosinus sp. sgz500959 TaxID=3242472 RepID=UPI0036721E2A